MNHYTLLEGDCLHWLPQIRDESIDFIVTSPPYNVGIDYGEYQDSLPYEDYLDWLDLIWTECYRVLKDGARICINVNDTNRNPYFPLHCDITSRIRKKWYMMGIIVWDKQTCMSNTAWGSWLSASAPSLRGLQEYIIVAGKGGKFFKKGVPDDAWKKDDFLDATKEIWRFTPETRMRKHPAPFPLELPRRAIKLFCYPNDIVLDPFIGSGTTMEACQQLQRSCIGIDLNPDYIEMTKKRCFWKTFLDRKVSYHSSLDDHYEGQ